jgi:opacity protein-like surface antigen
MHNRRGLVATLAVLALFSTGATAQRFYIGASGGTTRIETDYVEQATREIESPFSVNDFVATEVTVDARGTPGRLFAGFQFSEVFAVEADYTRLGNIRSTLKWRLRQHSLGHTQWDTDNEPEAFGIALLARAPLSRDVSLFGRAGVAHTRMKYSVHVCQYLDAVSGPVGCGTGFRAEAKETRPVAGLGIDWRFAGSFALRASWDRYFGVGKPFVILGPLDKETYGEYDIDYFGLGVTYSF